MCILILILLLEFIGITTLTMVLNGNDVRTALDEIDNILKTQKYGEIDIRLRNSNPYWRTKYSN